MNQIYFDNGSTSFPKAPGVAEGISQLLTHGAFNVNRGNYEGAYEVEEMILETREQLCHMFHGENAKSVIFTPGITYSLNYVIQKLFKPGDHVLVSGMEHNAMMRPLNQMKEEGVTYDEIPCDMEGSMETELIPKLIKRETKAILMLHASNVCGTVLPIEQVGEICSKYGLFFIVDSAQTAGTIEINMEKCGIDFLGFTGHKGLLGPQGIGGFLLSEQMNQALEPLIAGGTGSQSDLLTMPQKLPDKFESGTMNIPGIIGLHKALQYIEQVGIPQIHKRKMELTKHFLEQVREIKNVRVIGKPDLQDRTAVVSLDFLDRDNGMIAFELEQNYGVMTRVGLHCAPCAHRSLHTFPQGTVRFSFSHFNSDEEIDLCVEGIKKVL